MYKAPGDGLKLADKTESVNEILFLGVDDSFTSGIDVNGIFLDGSEFGAWSSIYFMQTLSEAR